MAFRALRIRKKKKSIKTSRRRNISAAKRFHLSAFHSGPHLATVCIVYLCTIIFYKDQISACFSLLSSHCVIFILFKCLGIFEWHTADWAPSAHFSCGWQLDNNPFVEAQQNGNEIATGVGRRCRRWSANKPAQHSSAFTQSTVTSTDACTWRNTKLIHYFSRPFIVASRFPYRSRHISESDERLAIWSASVKSGNSIDQYCTG